MKKDDMTYNVVGENIELKRDQWKGNVAYISDYPGLLDDVKKYTWTYSDNGHPYIRSGELGKSLHYFVLSKIMNKDKLDSMIKDGCIIEHLDNNGLNCSYTNLHVLSEDMNKAKAFSLDKAKKTDKPPYIVDIYYNYEEDTFQLQLFFNMNAYYEEEPIEGFTFKYNDFDNLYVDWFCLSKNKSIDIDKFRYDEMKVNYCEKIKLTPEKIDKPFIVRDGEIYANLGEKDDGSFIYLEKTARRK